MDPLGITLAVSVAVGVAAYLLGRGRERARQRRETEEARDEASRIRNRAEGEAENLRRAAELQAKEKVFRLRETWEKEEGRRREEVERGERRLAQRSESTDRKADQLDRRHEALEARAGQVQAAEEAVVRRREEAARALEEVRGRLESMAGITSEEAKAELVAGLEDEARADAANSLREIKEEAQRTAEREAKRVLAMAIQRMAADETAQLTVSVVQLPSDEMKGRIIGREGRNIRAFEQATGIDVIIDDTPEAVVLSGYNPVRREVARLALARLIEDGRIHPGRIEEVVAASEKDVEKEMREAAEEALYALGIHNVHPEIVKVLGALKYRTSFGQNQLGHAREVAVLAGNMAAEMGLDVKMARRAGLLHDVGKGLTHEQELTHVELGHRLCKRYKEHDIVLNAIRAHHDEEPHRHVEAWLVTAADAISGSRPGARREMFEGYVKRLEKLEEIATEHPGVVRCFAIQAGRELRVMVEPERVSDEDMARISEAVARKIESELQYPGQIKVVVIRETRAIDFAR
ncbi:MAG: ribonuclease Y [Gemmatimonadetes bacterium]|nr:ribonuclease Y [Gemmatimonadota bacterium]MXX34565.1 ribonuclease Y [Gemmatimonadota bacterium]MYD13784.1 ribonuclease Y [Gemmatimonadota bacterium]MYE69094.1 ribonuclease Y [Gemmatimonadota bacterium]MYI65782.1 ribonuclease Y [Gemmatimonadota bacterium]